jgi:predicted O-methyltransferase YrrM
LEIGLAYGYSTCFFLAAQKANGGEQHIACDPYQFTQFHGIGFQKAPQFGLEKSFRLVGEFSSVAIPMLKMEGLKFDVIYIDGSHFFDDTLVDFTLSNLVCAENGYIILDDMWMPSIQKVVAFIDRNRKDYVKENTPEQNITVYRKVGPDDRDWQHFVDF